MQAWLRRLVGRFRTEARIGYSNQIQNVRSIAMCSGIGDGPGVRCLIGAPDERTGNAGILPILYFGIDPDNLEIQLMAVSGRQVGSRSGMLVGDAVVFVDNWEVCHHTPGGECLVAAEITAEPSADIFMTLALDFWSPTGHKIPNLVLKGHSYDMDLRMYRDPSANAAAPQKTP